MRRPLLILLVAGAIAAPATASAAPVAPVPPPAGYGVAIQDRTFDRNGDPVVSAWVEDPAATVTWHACAPECGAAIATGADHSGRPRTGGSIAPGPTAAGTSFEVRATAGGTTRTARTPEWGGPISPATPPTLAGEVRIGRVVRAVPGTWSGGWPDDFDIPDLTVCPTPADGPECTGIGPDPSYGLRSSGTATIDPLYAGWFVRPTSGRHAVGETFGGIPPAPEAHFGMPLGHPRGGPGSPATAGAFSGPIPAARPGTLPTVAGRLAAGSRVAATPGTWPDAPDDGVRATGLRACPTRADTQRCRVIAPAGGPSLAVPSSGSATLGADLLGWYVGAFERRGRTTGNVAPFFAPGSPGLDRPPVAGPGMIVGPLSATPVRLGFTPRITLAAAARVTGGRVVVGRVRCAGRCVVHLRVSGRGRTVARRFVVRGSARLSVSARRLPRDVRRVRSTVRVDHATARAVRAARVR